MRPAAAAAVTLLLALVHVQEAAADDVTGRVRHNCQTRYPAHACGDGWFRIDVYRCAKYFRTLRTFRDADNNCRRLRGHLVSMHNSVEYSQVLCLAFRANTHKDHFWIGGRSKYLWHSFQWTDNTPFHFARWGFMQPDMVSGEACVEMNYKRDRNIIICLCAHRGDAAHISGTQVSLEGPLQHVNHMTEAAEDTE